MSASEQANTNSRRLPRWVSVCLLLLSIVAGTAFAQSARIAYVDMQRLIENAPQVASARAQLANEFKLKDQQLKAAESRLAELMAKQSRETGKLAPAAAKQLENEIELLKRNTTRLRETLRNELNTRSAEELNKRWPQIHEAVVRYARENKIDLVVESPVVYAAPSIDITDEVLARLRATPTGRTP